MTDAEILDAFAAIVARLDVKETSLFYRWAIRAAMARYKELYDDLAATAAATARTEGT